VRELGPVGQENELVVTREDEAAGANKAPDADDGRIDVRLSRQLFAVNNEAPEEAGKLDLQEGLKELGGFLQDVLSDRESLALACRDDPPQLSDETRLGVAKACASIAKGLLDDTSHKTRSAGAAANAPRAPEWVRHALHPIAEKPFRNRAAEKPFWDILGQRGLLGGPGVGEDGVPGRRTSPLQRAGQ
jgi:hypothetical protein